MTDPRHDGATAGEAAKRDVHDRLAAYRDDYVRHGQRVLLDVLLTAGVALIDVVRDRVPLPPGISPKLFGAVPGSLVRAGIIVRDGFAVTARPIAHARPVARWALRDATKARQWLAANPPPPPKDTGRPAADTSAAPDRTLFD